MDTANEAVLAEGTRVLIDDEQHFDGVTADGRGRARVEANPAVATSPSTVIIDLTGSVTALALPGYWTWSRAAPSRR